MRYQIVIPMSGFGERFRKAGYDVPKPLVMVDGKPIIAHVLDMFPGEKDVYFICNKEHLENPLYQMEGILHKYAPEGHICGIEPHKLGPVYAVSKIFHKLDPKMPTIVNYCDFTCQWNWQAFQLFAGDTKCDGAVICYTGFHPHMLDCCNYAYVKIVEENRIVAIQEKQPYTDKPMQEYASSGTYYFRSAALMQEAFEETLSREDLLLKSEYYASLAYRPLLEQGKDIRVFTLNKFCQWGTPEDLQEWEYHAKSIRAAQEIQNRLQIGGVTLVPLAGMGSRFTKEGYKTPKPLITVANNAMVISAWKDLPLGEENIFVLREDMPEYAHIKNILQEQSVSTKIITLSELTDGQARTCLLGLESISDDIPLTIGACDNGLRYDLSKFNAVWADGVGEADKAGGVDRVKGADVIVWTIRGYPGAIKNPQMYGWVDVDATGHVKHVSVKKPLSNPKTDPVVTGSFTFRRVGDFRQATERMIERNGIVNNEFYVDECINDAIALGLDVRIFDVDAYLCWGTPNDLKTYEYWEEFFRM